MCLFGGRVCTQPHIREGAVQVLRSVLMFVVRVGAYGRLSERSVFDASGSFVLET